MVIACYSPDFSGVLPQWVWLLSAVSMFWYMTLDATDGKQARRTDNCSPLGQILDHNLD
jgi:phosphatidylglycerophosphate synthase